MDIRLIVSDIDGTLLPKGGKLSPATKAAVAACRERGVEFVIASGRWYPAALKVVEQLGISDGVMIVCNGGAVVRMDGSVLMENGLSPEQAQTAYEILRAAPVMTTCYVHGGIYRLKRGCFSAFHLPEEGGYFYGGRYDVVDEDEAAFRAALLRSPHKLEAYADEIGLLPELREKLESAGLQVNSAFPFNLEIMSTTSGKGTAVEWLTAHMGLNREQVMGFGDYTNDLPMLRSVGWPVAVDNAHEDVKAVCRILAPSCEDDGVAKTIRKYILGDEEK